jgi:hypothetical protein
MRALLASILFLALAACSNPADLLIGAPIPSGETWPPIQFQDLRSIIGAQVNLSDPVGNPTGDTAWLVVISDQNDLCTTLATDPNYFRRMDVVNNALLLFVPAGRLGTFIIGRISDDGTFGELVASGGPTDAGAIAQTTPFEAIESSYIALTNWDNGNSNGSFDLFLSDPLNIQTYEYTGTFEAGACPALATVLVP